MRTDGVHRLVLNTPVFKDMNVGTHDGKEPSGRTMHLTGLEEGKPRGFQVKVRRTELSNQAPLFSL
jgi:Ran-binding protein 3